MKWITCGSFQDPKKAKEFILFSSKEDYATEQEAQSLAQQWQQEKRYPYIWVERVGK